VLLHPARQQSSPSQLMTALGTDTAGMAKLLDRLEIKGLIERRSNPGDRRSVLIALTSIPGEAVGPGFLHTRRR
jgi:DNA-binding MarR family transcriptional regulator